MEQQNKHKHPRYSIMPYFSRCFPHCVHHSRKLTFKHISLQKSVCMEKFNDKSHTNSNMVVLLAPSITPEPPGNRPGDVLREKLVHIKAELHRRSNVDTLSVRSIWRPSQTRYNMLMIFIGNCGTNLRDFNYIHRPHRGPLLLPIKGAAPPAFNTGKGRVQASV